MEDRVMSVVEMHEDLIVRVRALRDMHEYVSREYDMYDEMVRNVRSELTAFKRLAGV